MVEGRPADEWLCSFERTCTSQQQHVLVSNLSVHGRQAQSPHYQRLHRMMHFLRAILL